MSFPQTGKNVMMETGLATAAQDQQIWHVRLLDD